MDIWLLLVWIGLIGFSAGFVHSAIGFGFGIVAISLLPLVIDARSAHVVVSISSVPMLLMAAWAYREGVEWKSLKVSLLGAGIFLPLGLALFEVASLDWLVRGTGLAILGMVLMNLWNQRKARRTLAKDVVSADGNEEAQATSAGATACFLAGAASGFLGGAVSIAGPPIAAFALRQPWSQARFKSFVTQCLLLISVYKAVLLIWRDWFVGDVILLTAVASLISIAGVQLGAVLSARVPAAGFKRLVAVALIAVSIMMMWRGQPPAAADVTPDSPAAESR